MNQLTIKAFLPTLRIGSQCRERVAQNASVRVGCVERTPKYRLNHQSPQRSQHADRRIATRFIYQALKNSARADQKLKEIRNPLVDRGSKQNA